MRIGSLTYKTIKHNFFKLGFRFECSNDTLNKLLLWEKKSTQPTLHKIAEFDDDEGLISHIQIAFYSNPLPSPLQR